MLSWRKVWTLGSNPETSIPSDSIIPSPMLTSLIQLYNVSTSFDIGTYIDNYFIGEGSTFEERRFICEVSPISNVGYVYTLEDF